MREVALLIPRAAVEDVLDRLLPLVPGGAFERERGREVELCLRGAELPSIAELRAAVGRWPCRIEQRTAADDWRERRLRDYEPDVIAGRLVVRPEWAPKPGDELADIVLCEASAFGSGGHPTTRVCLELLLAQEPLGGFADLGCGTGVLAILAARLGWDPVTAVDVQPSSVEAARINAEANAVVIDSRTADLSTEPPPPAAGIAGNVPDWLHLLLAASLPEPAPRYALISGFGPQDTKAVFAAYAERGLRVQSRVDRHGWVVAALARQGKLRKTSVN